MRQLVSIAYNGRTFSAYPGGIVLDAALLNGIGMPHDCHAGTCGSCRVRIVSGLARGGETDDPRVVLACRARALTDLELISETLSEVVHTQGRLVGIAQLAGDILEVAIEPARPILMSPGQHLAATFQGYPPRSYCPTRALDAHTPDDGLLRFHIQRRKGGAVSAALGRGIGKGHKVSLVGPHGNAYFRRGLGGRLVLLAGGAGFAPAWAIAHAALSERADRSILLIVGVERLRGLYMVQALEQMAACPNVRILVTCAESHLPTPGMLPGLPAEYLPPLITRDVVHAFGPPDMIAAVAEIATPARAAFNGEAFVPQVDVKPRSWLLRLLRSDTITGAPKPIAAARAPASRDAARSSGP